MSNQDSTLNKEKQAIKKNNLATYTNMISVSILTHYVREKNLYISFVEGGLSL